jgi:CRISPR system Cascade subunit CasE
MSTDDALWLSRLALDPRSGDVQRDLADCHALHRRLAGAALAGDQKSTNRLLYRVEPQHRGAELILLVQTSALPDWSALPPGYLRDTVFDLENPAQRRLDRDHAAISAGDRLRFRLRANPTRKIDTKTREDGSRSNGNRVPLTGEEAQAAWMMRKAEASGCRIVQTTVRPDPLGSEATGRQRRGSETRALTFAAVWFDGVMEVVDADALRSALRQGVGPGKAFGFGLLSVVRFEPTGGSGL